MLIVKLPHFSIPLIVRKSDGGFGYDSTDMTGACVPSFFDSFVRGLISVNVYVFTFGHVCVRVCVQVCTCTRRYVYACVCMRTSQLLYDRVYVGIFVGEFVFHAYTSMHIHAFIS